MADVKRYNYTLNEFTVCANIKEKLYVADRDSSPFNIRFAFG